MLKVGTACMQQGRRRDKTRTSCLVCTATAHQCNASVGAVANPIWAVAAWCSWELWQGVQKIEPGAVIEAQYTFSMCC